jgi:hypothetical protein
MDPTVVLKKEWFDEQWIVVADHDPNRAAALSRALTSIGFPAARLEIFSHANQVLEYIAEKKCAIAIIDDSVGVAGFREIHASLTETFGATGFFLYTVTEGKNPDFLQFAATARIDGVIYRPYGEEEFKRRIAEVFAMKWPNRYVESKADLLIGGAGRSDGEVFEKALEKEKRLGYRDALTPDSKIASVFGMRRTEHPAIKPGKAAFEKVRLSFKAIARNGVPLAKPVPIHAVEVDEYKATFECSSEAWEVGDHVSIEAEIIHGAENYGLRIEAKVKGEAGMGLIAVEFDEGNRSRFEAAMRIVTKRFKELKDFFKYAKGA